MEQQQKRPVGLLVIAIMSFISMFFGLINTTLLLLIGRINQKDMELVLEQNEKFFGTFAGKDASFGDIMDKMNALQLGINNNVYVYSSVLFCAYVLGAIGVIWMLRRKRQGFHM